MVSKKDLYSADLETMRTSRCPTTVMTANGEVRTNKKQQYTLKNWTYLSKLCFFKKLPQFFHWEHSVRIMGVHTTGPAVKNHISPKMARESIAIYRTMYHSWFLVYQRVPVQRPHLLLHHLHHRIPYLMPTDKPKIQYPKEVEVRAKSFGQTRCMNPQKPQTRIKIGNEEKYKEIYRMNCLLGYRNSERIWLMKVLQQSLGENPEKGSRDTSKSSHEPPMEPRAYVELGSGKHSVYTHFPKDPNCDICLKTKITRASGRRRTGTVVPRAEHFGDLITADHTILSEESESRNSHRYGVVVQDLATQWIQSYLCKKKKFPGDPEEPNEVPGAHEETKSHLHRQLHGIWQVL